MTTRKNAKPRATRATRAPQADSASASEPISADSAPVNRVRFTLASIRPGENPGLFAHTAAFLSASGLLAGGSVPLGTIYAVMGRSARDYHTRKGNFMEIPATFDGEGNRASDAAERLTAQGLAHFRKQCRPEVQKSALATAYANAMIHGKPDGEILRSSFGIVQIGK